MKEFKELREKIEKREEEFREELRPFVIEHLKLRVLDLTQEELERLSDEEFDKLINPEEEVVNKKIEEWITAIKNRLEEMPKIKKAVSLDELLGIVFSGEILKNWQESLRKKGHKEVRDLLKHIQYMPYVDIPHDVDELMCEYWRMVAEKVEELEAKK